MKTENLSTLKIHKLTQAQYEREREAGRLDANALYLTPDEVGDLSRYATIEQVDAKITSPTTATVGQLLMVKAVDESGKPVEWEVIDPATIFEEFGFTIDEDGTIVGGFTTDEHINDLIDAKLGVIENGTY